MQKTIIPLSSKTAEGYVIPTGPLNLVFAQTDSGVVSCGLMDVMVLDRFEHPAARVKATSGPSIRTLDDLLQGLVKDVNETAKKRGIQLGMTGREALEQM